MRLSKSNGMYFVYMKGAMGIGFTIPDAIENCFRIYYLIHYY